MSTIGESISRVRNVLKTVKEDPFMTDRFIYSLIMKYAKTFIKRESMSGEIYKYRNLFKEIPCLDLIEVDKKIYGHIIVQSKSYKDIKGRKVLNVLNQENKKLIISINCDKNELDVRIPGRKWMGSKPVKEEFENNLINDFC